ncbi:hypothetical protein QBC43DRAFT_201849 [Cladorrhinum sp. PSN259]|nr:hypothetical protein QBC43DRAFT_201849 [Cladorrhinum sp. PSN259]
MTSRTSIPIPIPFPIPIPQSSSPSYSRSSTSCSSLPDSGYATRTTSTQSSLDFLPKSKISADTALPPAKQQVQRFPIPGLSYPDSVELDSEDYDEAPLYAFRVEPEGSVVARYREILPEVQKIIAQFILSTQKHGGGVLGFMRKGNKRKKERRGGSSGPPMAIRLMLVGKRVDEAKPTIVVFVGGEGEKDLVKKLEGLMMMKKGGAADVMRGLVRPDDGVSTNFEVLVVGEGPRKRNAPNGGQGGEDVVVVWDGGGLRTRRGLVTYCGTRIRFEKLAGEQSVRSSGAGTLGGLVKLTGEDGEVRVVGITAGHVLEGLFDDDDDDDDDDEEEEEEESEEEPQDAGVFLGEEHGGSYRRILGQLVYPTEYGSDEEMVDFIPARDWALFKLDEEVKLKPNILGRPGVDWEQRCNGRKDADEMTVAPPDTFPSLSSIEVVMLSQSDHLRGVKCGELSHLPGGFMLSPEKGFVEAYLLKLDEGEEIQDGDSGSWVINPVSKEVFGHVVATDYTGDAYVIPLHAIFDDIKHDLGVGSVELPTTADLLNIALQATRITTPTLQVTRLAQMSSLAERQPRGHGTGLDIWTSRECSRERHISELLSLYHDGVPSSWKRRSLLSDRDSGYGSPGSPLRIKFGKDVDDQEEEGFSYW